MFNSARPMNLEAGSQERWSGGERAEQKGFQLTQAHEQSAGLLMDRGSTDVINQMRGASKGFAVSDLTLFDAKDGPQFTSQAMDKGFHMDRSEAVAMAARSIQMRNEVSQTTAAA